MTASSGDRADRIVVEPGDRRPAVLEVIDGARERLNLSVFRCDDDPVIESLERAVRRGVQVRALMTGRAKGSKAQLKQLRKLLEAIDDHTAAIGSISLSTLALEFRRELAVVVRDRPSLDALEDFWSSLPTADAAPSPAGMPMELS